MFTSKAGNSIFTTEKKLLSITSAIGMELLIEMRSNMFIVKCRRLRNACHNGCHNLLNVKLQMIDYSFRSNISTPRIIKNIRVFTSPTVEHGHDFSSPPSSTAQSSDTICTLSCTNLSLKFLMISRRTWEAIDGYFSNRHFPLPGYI
jgi:hypothetical protein